MMLSICFIRSSSTFTVGTIAIVIRARASFAGARFIMSCTFSRSPKASGHPPIFTAIGWVGKKRVARARSFAGVGMPMDGARLRMCKRLAIVALVKMCES